MDRARRAMPIGNKACHARFVKAQQERHKKKLREMKASIDTKEPHTRQGGKRRNPKKEQMMEERYAQIERDNRLLLEKMSYIMRHQSMDIREDTGEYSQSLNRERRKRELQRITRENQKILARIHPGRRADLRPPRVGRARAQPRGDDEAPLRAAAGHSWGFSPSRRGRGLLRDLL